MLFCVLNTVSIVRFVIVGRCLMWFSVILDFVWWLSVAISQGNFVFFSERKEFVSVYPVLSAGKTEGNKVAFFYPSQNGYLTYPTVPGNRAGGHILWVVVLQCVIQVAPP